MKILAVIGTRLRQVMAMGALTLLVLSYQNCGNPAKFGDSPAAGKTGSPANPTGQVCDPTGGALSTTSGLSTNLYALDSAGQHAFESLAHGDRHVEFFLKPENLINFDDNGTQKPINLFFNQVNIPTVGFEVGFRTQSGTIVKNSRNSNVFEWFAFDLRSNLKLKEASQNGLYQFALISDDGSVLNLTKDGGSMMTIDSNFQHSTRLVISTEAVNLNEGSLYPLRLKYNQGPRYEVALILLWRKMANAGDADTTHNGLESPTAFFEWSLPVDDPNRVKQNYKDLLAKGWAPIPAEHFQLDEGVTNPCVY